MSSDDSINKKNINLKKTTKRRLKSENKEEK